MEWKEDHLRLLDQTLLPHQSVWKELRTWQECANAIQTMMVRGAPAIAVCGCYGLALAALANEPDLNLVARSLLQTRPTAVNLQICLNRMMAIPQKTFVDLLNAAQEFEREDRELCNAIGENGQAIVKPNARILTICNTGALATAGDGTALAVIRHAHRSGKAIHVYTCETRPRMQGLKLTAWELLQEEIPFTSIVDSAAAMLMQSNQIDVVIAGADRIAANGDTANKIGTYMLAVIAAHHKVPFYIAAPRTTFDLATAEGSKIIIEERADTEVTTIEGHPMAAAGTKVYNPAFDVTPNDLITGFITESGIIKPPFSFDALGKR